MDFFQARYFSSVQGRFVSPDDFAFGPTELFAEVAAHNPTFYADIAEPQSLNKYSYCLNNPLKFVDPDGHQATTADAIWQAISYPAPLQIKALVIAGIIVGAIYEGGKNLDITSANGYACGDFMECGYVQQFHEEAAKQNILSKSNQEGSGNQNGQANGQANGQQSGNQQGQEYKKPKPGVSGKEGAKKYSQLGARATPQGW